MKTKVGYQLISLLSIIALLLYCAGFVFLTESSPKALPSLATTGTLFDGSVKRPSLLSSGAVRMGHQKKMERCKVPVVAVTTTIKSSTVCITGVAQIIPVVVVGDQNSLNWELLKNTTFLSLKTQRNLYKDFAGALPINSFARKNIGYIYAMMEMGACAVWDFDDDNCLTLATGRLLQGLDKNPLSVATSRLFVDSHGLVINPYLMYGTEEFIWPRGYPFGNVSLREWPRLTISQKLWHIDVLQVLQNIAPDVDANWRLLTGKRQLVWMAHDLLSQENLMIHPKRYAPFNAQSTLISQRAMAAAYLPHTINGRVSDIWRSYIMQYFFKHFGDSPGILAFGGQFVNHHRNSHNYMADLNAEQQLIEQTDALVKYLHSRPRRTSSFSEEFVWLMDDLYTRKFVEADDVKTAQMWASHMFSDLKLTNEEWQLDLVPARVRNVTAFVNVTEISPKAIPLWIGLYGNNYARISPFVSAQCKLITKICGISIICQQKNTKEQQSFRTMLLAFYQLAIDTEQFLVLHASSSWSINEQQVELFIDGEKAFSDEIVTQVLTPNDTFIFIGQNGPSFIMAPSEVLMQNHQFFNSFIYKPMDKTFQNVLSDLLPKNNSLKGVFFGNLTGWLHQKNNPVDDSTSWNNRSQCAKLSILPHEKRTFWSADAHDGTRLDFTSFLHHIGHDVVVAGYKRDSSPYPKVLKQMTIPPLDHEELWLSPLMKNLYSNRDWIESDIRSHFEFMKNSTLIAKADAFLCMFPSSACEAWMPFNKSIMMIPAHRFLLRRCSLQSVNRLIDHTIAMFKSENPKHLVAGASYYDVQYIKYFTGLDVPLIPMNSFLYAGCGAVKWTHKRPEILFGPLQRKEVPPDFHSGFLKALWSIKSNGEKWTLTTAKRLYHHFQLQDLADHRAFILIPYATCSYGITEVYAMNIPIFAPSLEAMCNNTFRMRIFDRRLKDTFYCGDSVNLPPQHNNSHHPYSPEANDDISYCYWIKYADIWMLPHITYFDSFEDLINKLDNANFEEINHKMMHENERRYHEILQQLTSFSKKVDKGRTVPQSYDQSLKELLGVSQLQAN